MYPRTQDPYEIPSHEITQPPSLTSLGMGSFASVAKVMYRGQAFAMKVARVQTAANNPADELEIFNNEKRIFELLTFTSQKKVCGMENIINYYGHAKHNSYGKFKMGLVMELAEGGVLRDIIELSLPLALIKHYATGMVSGLNALHSYGIIHCDVKLDNMLLTKDGVVKIMDFGLSKVDGELPTNAGSVLYFAPELLNESHTAIARAKKAEGQTKKTDIYSMGLALWELQMGPYDKAKYPLNKVYPVTKVEDLEELVVNQNRRPPIDPRFSYVLSQWTKACWAADPDNRTDANVLADVLRNTTNAEASDTVAQREALYRSLNMS